MIGKMPLLFLLFCVILVIQIQDRVDYMEGESRGMDCIGSKATDAFGERVYRFNPNAKPVKRYMTWREFWTIHGYIRP
jgi:hypothetical protein